MAIITSTQTGDWDLASTWVGGVVPLSTDDAVIATTHTVSVTDTRLITALTFYGSLTVATTGSLTHSGNVLHDPTASGDGGIELQGGAVLQPSGLGLTWTFDGTNTVHAKIFSSGTSISTWARFGNTAAGNTVYFVPLAGTIFTDIIEFDCQYVEFWRVDDGSAYFINNGQHNATSNSNWSLPNCFFNHCGTIRFGGSSNPGADLVFDLRNSDFRNPAYARVVDYASNDAFTAYRGMGGATINGDGVTKHEIYIPSNPGAGSTIGLDGIVSQDCSINNLATAEVSLEGCILREKLDITGSVFVKLSSGAGAGGSLFTNNICQSESVNSHFMTASGVSTARNTASGNIMFAEDDDANMILYGDEVDYTQNITVGGSGPGTTGGNDNNVINRHTHINNNKDTQAGLLFETAAYTGVIDFTNSLIVQSGGTPFGYIARALAPIVNQLLGTVGYNGYFNLTGTYLNVSITTDNTANDVSADPQFGNINATLATWDTANGGPGTINNAIDKALGKNGRDASGTLAAFDSNYTYANGFAYFQDAFAPRNIAYQGTGDGGVDIGALAVVISGNSVSVNDVWVAKLKEVLSQDGHVNNLVVAYLQTEIPSTAANVNDLWFEYLSAYSGTNQDRLKAYLAANGYTGHLNTAFVNAINGGLFG